MKKVSQVNSLFDVVIDYRMTPVFENNEPVEFFPGIFKHKSIINHLYFYIPVFDSRGNINNYQKIILEPSFIDGLKKEIDEIRLITSNIEKEDDLPY